MTNNTRFQAAMPVALLLTVLAGNAYARNGQGGSQSPSTGRNNSPSQGRPSPSNGTMQHNRPTTQYSGATQHTGPTQHGGSMQHAGSTQHAGPTQHVGSTQRGPVQHGGNNFSGGDVRYRNQDPQDHVRNGFVDHRAYADARRYRGRIPHDHFRARFGRAHSFYMPRPMIVAGYPRFFYGGYWFGLGTPLPMTWSNAAVYVAADEDGNYFLCNPADPNVQLPLMPSE